MPQQKKSASEGVVVGCDRNQERLLSWWWDRYAKHNRYPVAFADFGMSPKALAWCRKKGELIGPIDSIALQENIWGDINLRRMAWFKKPFACLRSPFAYSCWIDLDCEIRGDISPLFSLLHLGIEIALAQDVVERLRKHTDRMPKETIYNSGVIAFRSNAEFLTSWAEEVVGKNDTYLGDQDALSRIIDVKKPKFAELPPIYNWNSRMDPNPDAIIVHHTGETKNLCQMGLA